MSIAIVAAKAAAEAAAAARDDAPLRARAKSVSADLVTDADAKAEAAAVAVLNEHRPDDAIVGEEGTDGAGCRRAPLVGRRHRRHGRVRLRHPELVQRRGARGRARTEGDGRLRRGQPGAAHRRARPGRVLQRPPARRSGTPGSLLEAHVAVFLRQDRLVKPGVRESAHRILDQTGLIRHAGPGSLELAWVAAGRLDAWIQPDTDPWDWLPGALLVTEAGGEARVVAAPVALAHRRFVSAG